TQTIPQRRVYHELQADLRSMMSGIQTQEQLDDLRERLGQIGRDMDDQARRDTLQDPPTISRKGRPLTKRLTEAREGRPQGGGGTGNAPRIGGSQRLCSRCHKSGHTRPRCPLEGSA
ncbi:hypothetical protein B0H10DRAFT_1838602, partial [Mycena sp. CBHHK59/15]